MNKDNMIVPGKVLSDSANSTEQSPSREKVWEMFNRISRRYDFLNHFLSAGQDIRWRKKTAKFLPDKNKITVLDLATGTGDLLITFAEKNPAVTESTGMDLAESMLEIGRQKINQNKLEKRLNLKTGDVMDIPASSGSFDVVSIAFGIRNVIDVPKGLKEIHRVLNDRGRLLVLEFSLPANRVIRQLYLFYFRHILPYLGGIISGDRYAYRYLNTTVETFPYGEKFCQMLREAGFKSANFVPLTFGIASIYIADK